MWKLTVLFILGAVLGQTQAATRVNAAHVARMFMAKRSAEEGRPELSQILQLTEGEGLQSDRSITTAQGHKKTRYHETYKGLPVYDSVVSASEGDEIDIEGTLLQGLNEDLPDVDPAFPAEEAIEKAKAHHGDDLKELTFENEEAELNVYHEEDSKVAKLVYIVSYLGVSDEEVTRPITIVDAKSGDVLDTWQSLDTHDMHGVGGNVKIGKYKYGVDYDAMKTTSSDGVWCTLQNTNVKVIHMQHKTSGVTDAHKVKCSEGSKDEVNGAYSAAHDALYFGGVVFDMFKNWFGTRPLTQSLTLRVHYGRNYENAFWDGQRMTFGDGYNYFHPLVSLDVTAHEVSHGFTQQNSNLQYRKQSGGMNEAFSDMSGEAAEYYMRGSNDFKVGYDIFKGANRALRYMINPPDDGKSIGHISQYYDGMDVHYSSGVYNKAFYTLTQRPGWDTRKAFEIFVIANQLYWHATCKMEECACGVKKAAVDKGYSTDDVAYAFSVVGLTVCGNTPVTNPPPTTSSPSQITPLEIGKPKYGLSGLTGQQTHFVFTLDSQKPKVFFKMSQGSGDSDMYIRYGAKATALDYDYRPFSPDSDEEVELENPPLGKYYVMLRGYGSYSGARLEVTDNAPSPSTNCESPKLCDGSVLENLQAAQNLWVDGLFIEVPSGAKNLMFEMSGGTGDADIYVRYNAKPTTRIYDHRPYKVGNNENVKITTPKTGKYFVGIRAYKAFSGVTLKVSHEL